MKKTELRIYKPFFIFFVLIALFSNGYSQESAIDFRFSPEYWYSAIGFPGDYHKTLVDEKGSLLYDFGPGPYVRPNTVISFGLVDDELSLEKQYYEDARVPIVLTKLKGLKNQVALKTFSLIPDDFVDTKVSDAPIWRTNGLTGTQSWASPPDFADPAFRHVAWGTNRPIEYHIRVKKGEAKTVVLGFCESYRTQEGLRTLELHVEGADVLTFDPLTAGPSNTPQVYSFAAKDDNRDGIIDIDVLSPKGDPNTILNVIWVFAAGYEVDEEALIRGNLSQQAEIYLDAGQEPEVVGRSPRFDIIEAELSGLGTPFLSIKTKRQLRYDIDAGFIFADGIAFLKPESKPKQIKATSQGFELIFAKGTARVVAMVQDGFSSDVRAFPKLENAKLEKKIEKYWLETAKIPYDRIVVPDQRLQEMLDASIRTFYQSSEIVDGFLQFQPGVALYRGLWMHDGVYFAELALQLGDVETAKTVIEGYLQYQHVTGQVEVMRPNNIHRETPLFIWMLCRYAELTGDHDWLKAKWSHIEKGVEWLRYLREQTLKPGMPNYGLTPAGFADGGIPGVQPEYASVNWVLITLPKAIEFAIRYGKNEQAASWQKLYDVFLVSFKKAMQRDKQQDKNGNWFLPIRVGESKTSDFPQRGQWSLTEALMHGQYIIADDPLVTGTFAMLESQKVQGLIPSVGWLNDGIWVYYGGFLAEAYQKLGEGKKAADIFYAMANHASPVSTWPEEQMPKGKGRRTVGDYPHTWSSTTMVRLAIRLLALEDENDLILFRGLPGEWLKHGAKTELRNIATRFGRVSLKLNVSEDGSSVNVLLNSLSAVGAGKIVLDMSTFKANGFTELAHKTPPKWDAPFELLIKKEN